MASAKPGVHHVQLKPNTVPEALVRGSKFIMWNDVSNLKIIDVFCVDKRFCSKILGGLRYW